MLILKAYSIHLTGDDHPVNFKQIALTSTMILSVSPAYAADITLSTIDIVWVLIAAVLVFFMQAGFALIESGSTRSKNSINVMMKNYSDVCVGTLIFWMLGYGLMFGTTRAAGLVSTTSCLQVSTIPRPPSSCFKHFLPPPLPLSVAAPWQSALSTAGT